MAEGDGFDPCYHMDRHWGIWDDQHPDYCASLVKLVDALRDYIRASDDCKRDIEQEGGDIDPEGEKHMQVLQALLKDLEDWSFDPSLGGRVKEPKGGWK